MKFKNFQLIIDGDVPKKSDIQNIFNLGMSYEKNHGSDWYEITKDIIEDRFLWLYCEYDNSKLYNENVLNGENDEKEANPRTKSQVELRKQLFICYDMNTNLLYMNNIDKRSFVKHYISYTLQKKVDIKNIYATLEDFQNAVKSIKTLKFVQLNNLMNRIPDSIFQQQANIYGLDSPSKITLQVDYAKTPVKEIKNALQNLKNKKQLGEFESIILIGLDDQEIEQSFDFSSIIKAIEITIIKNENSRFDPHEVMLNFLNRIR